MSLVKQLLGEHRLAEEAVRMDVAVMQALVTLLRETGISAYYENYTLKADGQTFDIVDVEPTPSVGTWSVTLSPEHVVSDEERSNGPWSVGDPHEQDFTITIGNEADVEPLLDLLGTSSGELARQRDLTLDDLPESMEAIDGLFEEFKVQNPSSRGWADMIDDEDEEGRPIATRHPNRDAAEAWRTRKRSEHEWQPHRLRVVPSDEPSQPDPDTEEEE